MISHGCQATALVERVAHDAGVLRATGGVGPQPRTSELQVIIELLVGHARLDHGIAQLLVHLDDAVHARQHQGNAAFVTGGLFAVAEVFAGADRPDRHIGPGGGLHSRLHLLDRAGVGNDRGQGSEGQASTGGGLDRMGVFNQAIWSQNGSQVALQGG